MGEIMSYPAGPPPRPKANRSLGVLIIVAVALISVCVVLGCIGVVTDDRAKDAGIGHPSPGALTGKTS